MCLLISMMLMNTCQIGVPEPNNRSTAVWSPDENFQKKPKPTLLPVASGV